MAEKTVRKARLVLFVLRQRQAHLVAALDPQLTRSQDRTSSGAVPSSLARTTGQRAVGDGAPSTGSVELRQTSPKRCAIRRPRIGVGVGSWGPSSLSLVSEPAPMIRPLRILVPILVFLLVGGFPAWAQSDVSGSLPASDVSGILTQSDQMAFASDEVRIRMADVAARLARALRGGTLSGGVAGLGQPLTVPSGTADLLLASSRAERREAAGPFSAVLTEQGVPARQARALARASAGLLAGDSIDPETLLPALHAFNAVVDVAPTPFLARPPQEVVVVRSVLLTLLDGTVS